MRFDMHNLKVIPYPLYDIHFALYLIVSMLGDPSPPTGLPVCFAVCLSVCVQDISKSCGWIWMKLGGEVGGVTRTNLFDFGEDPNPDPGMSFIYLL